MNKTVKILLILAIVAVAVYLYLNRRKAQKEASTQPQVALRNVRDLKTGAMVVSDISNGTDPDQVAVNIGGARPSNA